MKRIQPDFINNLGIGAFAFIAISQFSDLLQYLLENLFIVLRFDPIQINWSSQVIRLILFSFIVVWAIDKFSQPIEIDTRKILKTLIVLTFGILGLEFLLVYLGTEFFIANFPEAFEEYHTSSKGSLELRGLFALIPILEYFLFGIILWMKSKPLKKFTK